MATTLQRIITRATLGDQDTEAGAIAKQHFKPGHKVVAEGHGLGRLKMGKARHDGVGVGLSLDQKALAKAQQLSV